MRRIRFTLGPLVVLGLAVGCQTERAARGLPRSDLALSAGQTEVVVAESTDELRGDGPFGPAAVTTASAVELASAADDVAAAADSESSTAQAAQPVETIDLATALAAIDGQHPVVGLARWRTQAAYAQLQAARTMWLPTLQAGASYHRFDGNLQNSNGQIIDVNRSSLQAGLGAGAVGAGQTIRPGLAAEFHLADALYQPKITERRAWARGHAADAALHDQLLEAALAHQQLLGAQQRWALAADYAQRIAGLARLTADFAAEGAGLQADADRLATERDLAEAEVQVVDEEIAAASARLSEALSAPPGTIWACAEPVATPIELTPASQAAVDLVSTGLAARPELKEAQCLVAEARERWRRERSAPLAPSVLLGMTYGGFGGGLGDTIDQFHDRAEFNAVAVWQVRNLGWGEAAARREQHAAMQQAKFAQVRQMDRVAREIVEAHGQLAARGPRLEATRRAIETAASSFDLNAARIVEGQGLPIEALQSAAALDRARRAYLDAVLDYNEAQLRLYRALGWPVQAP